MSIVMVGQEIIFDRKWRQTLYPDKARKNDMPDDIFIRCR